MADSPVPRTRPARRTATNRTLIAEAERLLRATPDVAVLRILPFGSRATGRCRADSDLDLVVIVPDDQYSRETWRALYRALEPWYQRWGLSVDLLVYSQSRVRQLRHLPGTPLREAFKVARAALGARA